MLIHKQIEFEHDCLLHEKALSNAQHLLRPHSLIESQRTWQAVASAPGVVAWGYAYENGKFEREVA